MKADRYRITLVVASVFLTSLFAVDGVRAEALQPAPIVRTDVRTSNEETPQAKIDDARRALEQAAAQADFASNSREVALLQRAHDDLSAAIEQLRGVQRQRTADLLSDLDQAMQRTAAKLGGHVSPSQEGFGPLVPDRQLLAGLATEAMDVQRNSTELQRLPNTIVVGAGQLQQPSGTGALLSGPIELANREPLSWPLGYQAAWPQIRVRF